MRTTMNDFEVTCVSVFSPVGRPIEHVDAIYQDCDELG